MVTGSLFRARRSSTLTHRRSTTSASLASTSASGSRKCAWSVPTVSRSASSASKTRCDWPRRRTSTWSRWPPWPDPRRQAHGLRQVQVRSRAQGPGSTQEPGQHGHQGDQLRPKIDPHDYGTKKGHVERFLKAGDKVKVTIMFRGREQSRPELGFRLLQRLAEDINELGYVESQPEAGRPQHGHGPRPDEEEGRRPRRTAPSPGERIRGRCARRAHRLRRPDPPGRPRSRSPTWPT